MPDPGSLPPKLPSDFGTNVSQSTFNNETSSTQKQLMNFSSAVEQYANQVAQAGSNPTPEQLAQLMTEGDNLQSTYNGLQNEVNDLQEQLNSGQLTQSQVSVDQQELSALQQQLQGVGTALTQLTIGVAIALAGYAYQATDTSYTGKSRADNTPDNPLIPEGQGGAQVSQADGPNLFLATGLMAIMMKAELTLIQQDIRNKLAELQVKQKGFQSYMDMAALNASYTYASDMDEANQYSSQAFCMMIGAGLSIGFSVMGLSRMHSMSSDVDAEEAALKDNPAYDEEVAARPPPANRTDDDYEYLPDRAGDRSDYEAKPGRKQIQDAEKTAKEKQAEDQQKLDELNARAAADPASTTVGEREAIQNRMAKRKQEITRLQNMKEANQRKIDDFNKVHQTSQLTQMDAAYLFYQAAAQASNSLGQAYGNMAAAMWTAQKAKDQADQVFTQAAMQIADKYLQSAMDEFRSQGQNIEAIVQFIMSFASKNTQWASLRA